MEEPNGNGLSGRGVQLGHKGRLIRLSFPNFFPTAPGQRSHFCDRQFTSVRLADVCMHIPQAEQFAWVKFEPRDSGPRGDGSRKLFDRVYLTQLYIVIERAHLASIYDKESE